MHSKMGIAALSQQLASGACSSEELTRRCFSDIEKTDGQIGAFLTLCREEALAQARESDRRRAEGTLRSPLDGIPYAAKDSFCTKGIRTTAASRMLKDYIPPYDATVISLLRNAGCVLVGKTNMDEFAMGSDTLHSALGNTRNPQDASRVAGGSSGGSAAAVGAGQVPFALGTDTGGSVRQPAAFCGVMGLKPTYGAISRYGMIAFASSLDCVGLLTGSAADTALVFDVLAKRDPMDATSKGYTGAPLQTVMKKGVSGLRIGVIADGGMGQVDPFVRQSVLVAAKRLEHAGATLLEVKLPSPEEALLSYRVISSVEASSNLARYDGFRYGAFSNGETPDLRASNTRGAYFGEEVKSRILLGTAMLTEAFREQYYLPACHVREEICRSVEQLFASCDLILQPTAPSGAFPAERKLSSAEMRRSDLCTVYASLAGIPAMSVPIGLDENNMPLGVQLMASPMREDLILRAARILE